MTTRYEADLQDHEPRIVSGVRGVRSRFFNRRFKNATQMERWLDANGADCEIYEIRRA